MLRCLIYRDSVEYCDRKNAVASITALEKAYERLRGGPFLIKQILLHEPIYQLGHVEL